MKLVLDTNAVMDWLHFRDAGFDPVARVIAATSVELVTSRECLEELRRVLARPFFGMDEAAQAAMCAAYVARAGVVSMDSAGVHDVPVCRDADDQKFLELAARAGAGYLLTKDRALLRLSGRTVRSCGFAVMTPADFARRALSLGTPLVK